MLRKIRLPLEALVVAICALATAGPASALAPPAADCQPITKTPCLLPFPNNLFTRADRSTPTRLRVHLPAAAMPANTSGKRIAVRDYDRADGFSPAVRWSSTFPGLTSRGPTG